MSFDLASFMAEHPELRARGERVNTVRLRARTVIAIRTAYARGVRRHVLASVHGVCWQTIDNIVQGRSWRHLLPHTDEAEAAA